MSTTSQKQTQRSLGCGQSTGYYPDGSPPGKSIKRMGKHQTTLSGSPRRPTRPRPRLGGPLPSRILFPKVIRAELRVCVGDAAQWPRSYSLHAASFQSPFQRSEYCAYEEHIQQGSSLPSSSQVLGHGSKPPAFLMQAHVVAVRPLGRDFPRHAPVFMHFHDTSTMRHLRVAQSIGARHFGGGKPSWAPG